MSDRSDSPAKRGAPRAMRLRWRVLSGALALFLAATSCGLPFTVSVNTNHPTQTPGSPAQAESTLTVAPGATSEATSAAATENPQQPTDTTQPGQPTATPKPQGGQTQNLVSKDSLSNVPSGDVIRELALFVGGGGGELNTCTSDFSQPDFATSPDDRPKMGIIHIVACGWQDGEKVKLVVGYPNGKQRDVGTQKAGRGLSKKDVANGVAFQFRAWPNDPSGTYTFTLQGSTATLTAQANITDAEGAQIFVLSARDYKAYTGKSTSSAQIFFFGFQPNEKIHLIAFHGVRSTQDTSGQYSVIGEMDLKVGKDGRLLVPTDLASPDPKPVWVERPEYVFLALRGSAGEAHTFTVNQFGVPFDVFDAQQVFCAGGGQPLFAFQGGNAQKNLKVRTPDGQPLEVHSGAGAGTTQAGSVQNGDILNVDGPPKCSDGVWWWQFYLNGTGDAYAPEKVGGKSVLEVVGK